MDELFIVLAIIVAILLVLIVLVQNSKGGGLSSQFGGSGAQQVIGVKKTTDLLEKVTWGFAIALFALSLASSVMINKGNATDYVDPNLDAAQQAIPQQSQDIPVAPIETIPADTAEQD